MILTHRAMKLGAMTYIKVRNRVLGERLPSPDIYYFGYGGNLTIDRFRKYQMNAEAVDVARLNGFALRFSLPCEYLGKGFASADEEAGSTVWGYLYKMDGPSLLLLDIMEWSVLNQYRRIPVKVMTRAGNAITAFTYQARHPKEGLRPSTGYRAGIVKAAKIHGFPEEYIRQIESVEPRDKFRLDHGFSLMLPAIRRPFELPLFCIYRWHDRLKEKICDLLRF